MKYLRWLAYLPFTILVTILCWFTNPIACLFTVRTNGRDDLIPLFYLWQTYDAHVDEFYFGHYADGMISKPAYDNSRVWRYWYRLRWLSRNTGYGWSYLLFSIPKGEGFQWKGQTRSVFGFYNDYNIGWKSHSGFDKLDFAGRILGLRHK